MLAKFLMAEIVVLRCHPTDNVVHRRLIHTVHIALFINQMIEKLNSFSTWHYEKIDTTEIVRKNEKTRVFINEIKGTILTAEPVRLHRILASRIMAYTKGVG